MGTLHFCHVRQGAGGESQVEGRELDKKGRGQAWQAELRVAAVNPLSPTAYAPL